MGRRYPVIGQSWRQASSEVVSFLAFREKVRRIVDTTNAIEALTAQLRRALRAKGTFHRPFGNQAGPSDVEPLGERLENGPT